MKKYIPIDFDDKGKVILGREKNTPTQNGTIPAIFIPGGSDENKQGLKSISISPAIQTTPALDSLAPIYYDDLTEEQKQDAVFLSVNTSEVGEKSVSITPTGDWYAAYSNDNDEFIVGGKGETIVAPVTLAPGTVTTLAMSFSNGSTPETATEFFNVNLDISVG